MPKSFYIGVNDVAKESVNGYIGVDGIARRIKKIYIGGEDGTAKSVYTRLDYIPSISAATNMYTFAAYMGAVSSKNYAIFVGGREASQASWALYHYTSNLTFGYMAQGLKTAAYHMGSASNGRYAVFAGGRTTTSSSAGTANISFYDENLTYTASTTTNSLPEVTSYLAGATLNNQYAVFAGGNGVSGTVIGTVTAYDQSLTRHILASGYVATQRRGCSVGGYALFAGGVTASISKITDIDVYNSSLTKENPISLSIGRNNISSANAGSYALFAGGDTFSSNTAIIDVYNKNLTRITSPAISLSTSGSGFAGTTVEDCALFAHGNIASTAVDIINERLTKVTSTYNLPSTRIGVAAASIGNYALFAGGTISDTYSNAVNAVKLT